MRLDEEMPLRGELLQTRKTDLMEGMHNAQFLAVVAAAGCAAAKPVPDDGIDWTVTHRSSSHKIGRSAHVDIQLRSTSRLSPPLGNHFPFPLDADTFDRLTEPSHIPRLLVVCILPLEIDQWITADTSSSAFHLRHLSYWSSIKPEHRTGRTQTTIQIQTEQVFDDLALCGIMQRIGRGEDL